jgi:hypothetical protein
MKREPLSKLKEIEEQLVYLDEEDASLYFTQNSGGDNSLGAKHTIFIHNNVLYKFSNPNDVVYSLSETVGATDTG